MYITKIEAIPFKIPYKKALRFSNGELTAAEHVLVRVHTDQGIVGHAEAPSRPTIYGESQASIVWAIEKWFAPAILGLALSQTETIATRLSLTIGNNTAKGAIDLAVWDAFGQSLGVSCSQLLGGWRSSVRVSDMLGFASPEQSIDHARYLHSEFGISAFKIKTGIDVEKDIRLVAALRTALPEAYLFVDANHGWSSTEAIRAARAMSEFSLDNFEEPCVASDRTGRRKLATVLGVSISGDESCTTLVDAARELREGVVQMICIKTARTGFTESRKIVHLCEGLSAGVGMGSQADTMIGTLGTLNFAGGLRLPGLRPAEIGFMDITDDLLANPLVVRGGHIELSQMPGLGIEIDESKLRRYRVDL